MSEGIYIEENGVYQIDCTYAIWSTDQINAEFHTAGTFLADADFAAEIDDFVYLIEYKNANIPNAVNPDAFQPQSGKKVDHVARKFYDSLHYLEMNGNRKPVKYIYIVEYPNAGITDRKMFRNKISDRLPFQLQHGKPRQIIEDFNVVSIAEWNAHSEYSRFPLTPIQQGAAT